jgi:beta-lactamase regulating signal transducer with metallopeptidase domain
VSATAVAAVSGWIAERGPVLLLGTSIVLAGGLLAQVTSREPAARRRLGVFTALGCAVYLAAALVPLPRWSWPAPAPPAASPGRAAPLRHEDLEELLASAPRPEPVGDVERAAAVPTAQTPLPAAPAVAAAPFPWPEALALAWCIGVLLMILRLLVGALRIGVLLARSGPAPAWLARAVPLPGRTQLRLARAPVRPFCTGVLRPVIVLPPEFAAPERSAQALAVLRHELAHVQANDAAVQILFALLAVPLFCHPLFWLLRARVRFSAELLADDAAARTGVHAYIRQLLDLAADAAPLPGADAAVPVFHRPSEFYRRIQMLLQRETPLSPSPSRARTLAQVAFTAALVAGSAGFFGAPLPAQDPDTARRTAALRDTIQSLQKEIEDLRAALQAMRDQRADENAAKSPAKRGAAEPRNPPPPQDPFAPVRLPDKAPTNDPAADPYRANYEKYVRDLADQNTNQNVDPAAKRDYVVQQGDTLAKILHDKGYRPDDPRYADALKTLYLANPDLVAAQLRVGQKVALPGTPDAPVENLFDALKNNPHGSDPLLGGSSSRGLAELTTRYLDLQGEVESAAIEAQELKQLTEAGAMSTREARQAQVRAVTAKKKFAVVEKLLLGEIESTKAEIAWLEQTIRDFSGNELPTSLLLLRKAQMLRAHANLEALESVRGGAAQDQPKKK